MRRIGDRRSRVVRPAGAEPVWCGCAGTSFRGSPAWTTVAWIFWVVDTSGSPIRREARITPPSGQQLVLAGAETSATLTRPETSVWLAGGQQSCSSTVVGAQKQRPAIWAEKSRARPLAKSLVYRTRSRLNFIATLFCGAVAQPGMSHEPSLPDSLASRDMARPGSLTREATRAGWWRADGGWRCASVGSASARPLSSGGSTSPGRRHRSHAPSCGP
jgi:hypothetical protein